MMARPTNSPIVAAMSIPMAIAVDMTAPKGKSPTNTTKQLMITIISLSLCPQILAHNQAGRNKV
jgi:hypothetical protein